MHRPGVELVTSQSQVQRPNHYTTESPVQRPNHYTTESPVQRPPNHYTTESPVIFMPLPKIVWLEAIVVFYPVCMSVHPEILSA